MHRDLPAARCQRQCDFAAQPFGGTGHKHNRGVRGRGHLALGVGEEVGKGAKLPNGIADNPFR